MSSALIQGIPRRAKVRVEALPEKTLVWKGYASGSLSLDLDPGKYIYKVHKNLGKKRFTGFCNEFLHELTEEQFQKFRDVQPKRSTFRMTSEGPCYSCGFTGCDESTSSGTAMVMHELEHQGQKLTDVLDSMTTDEMLEAINEGHESAVQVAPKKVQPTGTSAVAPPDPTGYVSTRQAEKQIKAADAADAAAEAMATAARKDTPPKRGPGRPRKDANAD